MPYGYKILLDSADITDKVSSFEITASMDSYVRELSVDLADPALYASMEFSNLPAEPSIEVFTKIATDWVSQGVFFAEKPTTNVGIHQTVTGIWGRSITALLGSPFAPKITQSWDSQTSFYGIADELCDLCGLTWDSAYCEIDDFIIYAGTYSAEDAYPIEILNELAEAAGAVIGTDRLGHVCVRVIDYAPSSADHVVTDAVTASISEPIDYPDFGNRIKVSASGSTSGYSVNLDIPSPCLPRNGARKAEAYVLVSDQDGNPVDGQPVNWSSDLGLVTFDADTTNTQTVFIANEEVKADDFYTVSVKWPVSSVLAIFARNDIGNYTNLAADGYEVDEKTITLVEPLKYCDQAVRVYYFVDGMATNHISGGATAGTDTVTVDVSGNKDTKDVYVANPCQCPITLHIYAAPSSIKTYETSNVVVYAEVEGDAAAPGTVIFMSEAIQPYRGMLHWTQAVLGWATITEEASYAINHFEGLCQCETEISIYTVIGVWVRGENEDGDAIPTGSNLYAGTFSGKTIDLNAYYYAGTELLVSYVARGAAINVFYGVTPGEAMIRAWVAAPTEEMPSATTTITVTTADADDSDEDAEPDGCCETTCEPTAIANQRLYLDIVAGSGFRVGETVSSGVKTRVVTDVGSEARTGGGYYVEVDSPAEEEQTEENVLDVGDTILGQSSSTSAYITQIVEADEGDTSGAVIVCSSTEECCVHKDTGKRGCWPSAQCLGGTSTGGKGGSGGKNDEDAKPTAKNGGCKKSDGTSVKCDEGYRCCTKFGIRDCYYHTECEKNDPSQCFTDNCMKTTGTDKTLCLQTRFARGLQIGGDGCECSSLCLDEYINYGTTQSYDGGSYRTTAELATLVYGLTPGTAVYNEKVGLLKEEAISQCLRECGECARAGALSITGSTAVTKPGGYQYTARGGIGPYQWTVTGEGASINTTGYMSLGSSACGSVHVTATDSCGVQASLGIRVTNAGVWEALPQVVHPIPSGNCSQYWVGCGSADIIEENLRYQCTTGQCRQCILTNCTAPDPVPSGATVWYSHQTQTNICMTVSGCKSPPIANWYCFLHICNVSQWVCP